VAFVTSTTTLPTSTSIAYYNTFVAGVAEAQPALAALGTSWKAIGSTELDSARDNTSTNPAMSDGVPIYRLDGMRIANDNEGLWGGTLLSPLSVLETGEPAVPTDVYTGTTLDGAMELEDYIGSTQYVVVGYSGADGADWISEGVYPLEFGYETPMYCISAELTVVPEPGTMTLACIGAAALAGCMLRRRRQPQRQ
jgi:hypothetical protein